MNTTYVFSILGTTAPCTGSWSISLPTYTCNGSVILTSGDSLTLSSLLLLSDINVVATGGFTLVGNTIGASGRTISLSDGASATSSLTGTNTINGSVSLNKANVTGSLQAYTATFGNGSTLGTASAPVGVTTSVGDVTLNNATAYGTFTAPNSNTIRVNGSSTVVGYCQPNSTPANACIAPAGTTGQTCISDDFSASTLSTTNWSVVSRNGTFGVPRIVNGRLRLTDDSGNVATAATYQRAFPTANSLITMTFDYFGYSNSSSRGADGIAVILSDASVTPQPGAFGGSLGYAQKTAITGFAGGWLGIGLDEFGNYSAVAEGRVGGVGVRSDAVAIRGSAASSYTYLTGTATLATGIDASAASATPAPGHRYRITIDTRTTGKALVTVERDVSGLGNSYTTLIAAFDVRSSSAQGALPGNFLISLTGSTGNLANIHDMDNMQVCSTSGSTSVGLIDHYEIISSSSTGLTCAPLNITSIRACQDAACTLYTDSVTASVTATGNSATTTTLPSTFTGGTSGTYSVSYPVAENATLGIASSSAPLALNKTQCRIGSVAAPASVANCTVGFQDSGFIITLPDMLAAKGSSGTIQAVKKDTTQSCAPGFEGSRSVSFTTAYSDPGSGSMPVSLNGTTVGSTATPLTLTFDNTATAPLTAMYRDAGKILVNATYGGSAATGDAGLVMIGATSFVSRPYGLCLQTDLDNISPSNPCTAASVAGCPVFAGGIRAGDSFPLRIAAVSWVSDNQGRSAAALCSNAKTPNFQLASITLNTTLAAPAGGSGRLTPVTYSHVPGNQTVSTASFPEVGIISVTAVPPEYFGQAIGGGTSNYIGRFMPASLGAVGSASLKTSCGSAFSYQGQPIAFNQNPTLTVTGYNRQGAVTSNYDRGEFWRLNTPVRQAYLSVIASRTGLNARLGTQGSVTTGISDSTVGDGAKSYVWSGEQLVYNQPTAPGADDYPVTAAVRQSFLAAALTDQDGACVGGTACTGYSFDFAGSDIRLGRLRIGNASGSELQGLSLPVVLESWQSSNTFQNEGLDTCTNVAALGALTLDTYTANLSAGETTATVTVPAAGVNGSIALSAPGAGNNGSVRALFNGMPNWLKYPWDGSTYSAASGVATFGIYTGATPLIFRRENYR
ncbi:DUF6701 domain-containing protein [Pseudomonas sp. LRF_L74]|uniref:DUF6701 domain-containing protein n=1 Tax=Pseudomonas sp. LRF_L74 TaxID=3369422 RepID=UPI003F63DE10